jgi:hypothetical protein
MQGQYSARGKIVRIEGATVVFAPADTKYQLHLALNGDASKLPAGDAEAVIHVAARKVLGVSGGGNFVAPIFGSPRMLQGRILQLDAKQMVLQCGLPIVVDLPAEAHAVDLTYGPLEVGGRCNVVAQPGASFTLCAATAAV